MLTEAAGVIGGHDVLGGVKNRVAAKIGRSTSLAVRRYPAVHDCIGTRRVMVIDPREYCCVGSTPCSATTLPLENREVVLTFDDGPLPPYTDRVLDTLAAERVRATFFVVGRMARRSPDLVRRAFQEGHTIATHTQNHRDLPKLSFTEAVGEIEDGIASASAALHDPAALAPFFRFPFLNNNAELGHHLASQGIMSWGADVNPEDWTNISWRQVIRRVLDGLERTGKGVILLHDIQTVVARALPELLRKLKRRGYSIVHVVPPRAIS
jgi:peptidoglycan-N-acetylglucosamine deacetylase